MKTKQRHHLLVAITMILILLLTACGRSGVNEPAAIPFPDESVEIEKLPPDASAPMGEPELPDSYESSETPGSDHEGAYDDPIDPQLPGENNADGMDELIGAINGEEEIGALFQDEEQLLMNLYGTWYNEEDDIYSLIIEEDLIKIVTGFEIDSTTWYDMLEINLKENFILIEIHTIDDGFGKYESSSRVAAKLEYNGNQLYYYHNHGQPDQVSSAWTR